MIEVKMEDNYKDVFFGGIVFRLNNDKDIQNAHKIIKDIFGEDSFNFGIEGGMFQAKKTTKSILLKYYGNVGSRFYKLFFRQLISDMKKANIEITYNPIRYADRSSAGFSKDDKLFYDLNDENSIMKYLED